VGGGGGGGGGRAGEVCLGGPSPHSDETKENIPKVKERKCRRSEEASCKITSSSDCYLVVEQARDLQHMKKRKRCPKTKTH